MITTSASAIAKPRQEVQGGPRPRPVDSGKQGAAGRGVPGRIAQGSNPRVAKTDEEIWEVGTVARRRKR
eukprot:7377087-Lingulodinium_polyedra.AAC.1